MVPLLASEITLFEEATLDAAAASRLLEFYRGYHQDNLGLFLALRRRWHDLHPGRRFGGLCANVHPLTGLLRPESEQFLWGWGDGRALSVWCSFFNLDRVPDATVAVTLADGWDCRVDLRPELAQYVAEIHAGLTRRIAAHGGRIPFQAHPETGSPVAQEALPGGGAGSFDFSNLFGAAGFLQFGLWQEDQGAVAAGLDLLQRCRADTLAVDAASPGVTRHGPRMIALGVIGEVLKSLNARKAAQATDHLRAEVTDMAPDFVRFILDHHYRPQPAAFWEVGDGNGAPLTEVDGGVVIDPGHATECAGFLAELVPFLRVDHPELAEETLSAALAIHLFADRIGFLPSGLMTKFADLESGQPRPDTQALAAAGRITAPWWNVREHCAAALRLYTLTRDARLIESYRRAQHASYRFYPNRLLHRQMIQMIDGRSGEPLDVPPATGNLDPMHDPRARVREMEYLEQLL